MISITASTSRKMPNPMRMGENTQNHDRLARPQEAPAIPAIFRTRRTAKANPRNETLTVDEDDACGVLLILRDLSSL